MSLDFGCLMLFLFSFSFVCARPREGVHIPRLIILMCLAHLSTASAEKPAATALWARRFCSQLSLANLPCRAFQETHLFRSQCLLCVVYNV